MGKNKYVNIPYSSAKNKIVFLVRSNKKWFTVWQCHGSMRSIHVYIFLNGCLLFVRH